MTASYSLPSPRRRWLAAGVAAGLFPAVAWLKDWRGRDVDSIPANAPATPTLTGRAPTLFIGHGSPMNALADNAYSRTLNAWGERIGIPHAILMVSAHWLTDGDWAVSVSDKPPMIYDFGGFPAALYEQNYPAPGAPAIAQQAATLLAARGTMKVDAQRGLDHGAWSVLKHLYPAANVPVFQLSINMRQSPAAHAELGAALAELRDQGVLIVGSGNVVHNLGIQVDEAGDTPHGLLPWAEDFDQRVKQALDAHDLKALVHYERLTAGALTAVPYPDHYYPLLYAMGAAQAGDKLQHVYEGFQEGTFSMRCLQWG